MRTMTTAANTLVLVDYQAALIPVIAGAGDVVERAGRLAQVAQTLSVPVIGTAQTPDKLGTNTAPIAAHCDHTMEKVHFDACRDGLLDVLNRVSPSHCNVVIAGCEAHVCVLQTALGLLSAGKSVWVVADACGARRVSDHTAAMERLRQAGATIVTTDMVIFEWLETCEHEHFRDVLAHVKALP